MSRIVSLLGLFTLGFCVSLGQAAEDEPKQNTGFNMEVPKAEVTVTAEKLVADYRANREAARKKYSNKAVRVNGVVKEVKTGETMGFPTCTLILKAGKDEVECTVPGWWHDYAKSRKAGDKVALVSKFVGLDSPEPLKVGVTQANFISPTEK